MIGAQVLSPRHIPEGDHFVAGVSGPKATVQVSFQVRDLCVLFGNLLMILLPFLVWGKLPNTTTTVYP